jgi:RNA polymerase sigma-70 factor (ECF subfamily)
VTAAADLGAWLDESYAKAYRTAVLICGDPDDAREAVQDAFLRAWRFRDALPDGDGRDPWLYRVVVNACYSKLRKEVPRRNRERARLDEQLHDSLDGRIDEHRSFRAGADGPEATAVQSELADAVTAALRALPDGLRVPVVLRYWCGMSEREIAVAIRRRPGTVKSRLHEARRRLMADAALAGHATEMGVAR